MCMLHATGRKRLLKRPIERTDRHYTPYKGYNSASQKDRKSKVFGGNLDESHPILGCNVGKYQQTKS